MNLKNIDLFRPESLLLFYLIFICLAIASFFMNLPIKIPGLTSFLVVFGSFPFYLIGIWAGKKCYGVAISKSFTLAFFIFLIVSYSFVLKSFFFKEIWAPLLIIATVVTILSLLFSKKAHAHKGINYPLILLAVGIAFLFLTILKIGGIPLLNPNLKFLAVNNLFWGVSLLTFIIGYVFFIPKIKSSKFLFLFITVSVLLFSLMAFRSVILVLLFTGVLFSYYSKRISNMQILVPLLIAALVVVFIGYLSMPILSPGKLLFYRAGTTYSVFDTIVQKSMPFGMTHGTLFFRGNPRLFVGSHIVGKTADITSTLLGPSVIDFGAIGAFLWMFFLGLILEIAYLSMKLDFLKIFYPLLFSFSLIWIEIGPDQFQLSFLFFFVLAYMLNFVKLKKD